MNIKLMDIVFVGCGPASITAVLRLLETGYKGSIVMIDKGKDVEHRANKGKDLLEGWAGCGCKSDFKITSSITTGSESLPLTNEGWSDFETYLISLYNKFKLQTSDPTPMKFNDETLFDTKNSGLIWDVNNILHVGTDRGQEIMLAMQKYIMAQPNVHVCFETEVEKIEYVSGKDKTTNYNVILKDKDGSQSILFAKKVVVATGRFGTLNSETMQKFNLPVIPRVFQLGIRVEDQMNPQYVDIIKAAYDFKFAKKYYFPNGISVRVRTFCCNSGNAHVAAEESSDGFTSFNGHAFHEADPTNHTVNYGIMCEVDGLTGYESREKQIVLMQKINALPTWKEDNFQNGEVVASRKLLDGFDHLVGTYPAEILDALNQFIKAFGTLVGLSKAVYYYPEVKPSGFKVKTNAGFETEQPGLYFIGDCLNTRGIIKASYEGYELANHMH